MRLLLILCAGVAAAQGLPTPSLGNQVTVSPGITHIAGADVCAGGLSGATTSAVDTTGASLIVISINQAAAGGITVSDSKSNSATALTAATSGSSSSILYYIQNPTVGTGHTFTVASANAPGFCVMAFTGMVTSGVYESGTNQTATASFTSHIQPGSCTPGSGNQLLITSFGTTAAGTISIDSGFSSPPLVEAYNGASNYGAGISYLIQSGSAAQNPKWTTTATVQTLASTIAAFQGQ